MYTHIPYLFPFPAVQKSIEIGQYLTVLQ